MKTTFDSQFARPLFRTRLIFVVDFEGFHKLRFTVTQRTYNTIDYLFFSRWVEDAPAANMLQEIWPNVKKIVNY